MSISESSSLRYRKKTIAIDMISIHRRFRPISAQETRECQGVEGRTRSIRNLSIVRFFDISMYRYRYPTPLIFNSNYSSSSERVNIRLLQQHGRTLGMLKGLQGMSPQSTTCMPLNGYTSVPMLYLLPCIDRNNTRSIGQRWSGCQSSIFRFVVYCPCLLLVRVRYEIEERYDTRCTLSRTRRPNNNKRQRRRRLE